MTEAPMTKAELLEALLIERWGHLHPEYRPTARDAAAADGRNDLDQDPAEPPAAALRLIADNTPDVTDDDTPTHLTGTEHK